MQVPRLLVGILARLRDDLGVSLDVRPRHESRDSRDCRGCRDRPATPGDGSVDGSVLRFCSGYS